MGFFTSKATARGRSHLLLRPEQQDIIRLMNALSGRRIGGVLPTGVQQTITGSLGAPGLAPGFQEVLPSRGLQAPQQAIVDLLAGATSQRMANMIAGRQGSYVNALQQALGMVKFPPETTRTTARGTQRKF